MKVSSSSNKYRVSSFIMALLSLLVMLRTLEVADIYINLINNLQICPWTEGKIRTNMMVSRFMMPLLSLLENLRALDISDIYFNLLGAYMFINSYFICYHPEPVNLINTIKNLGFNKVPKPNIYWIFMKTRTKDLHWNGNIV